MSANVHMCKHTYKHPFIIWSNATKSLNYCCAEYSLHFQCSFIFSIPFHLAIFINIYHVLTKNHGILPHCWCKLMGHPWSVNHNPINITPRSLMKVSFFCCFFLNEASMQHCFYTSFITGLLVVIFEWYSWYFIQKSNPAKVLGNTIVMPSLQAFLIADRDQSPTIFCRQKARTENWTRD